MLFALVRAKADEDADGRPVITVEFGSRSRTTAFVLEAWAEMRPDMARQIAQELLEAAEMVERQLHWKSEQR